MNGEHTYDTSSMSVIVASVGNQVRNNFKFTFFFVPVDFGSLSSRYPRFCLAYPVAVEPRVENRLRPSILGSYLQ